MFSEPAPGGLAGLFKAPHIRVEMAPEDHVQLFGRQCQLVAFEADIRCRQDVLIGNNHQQRGGADSSSMDTGFVLTRQFCTAEGQFILPCRRETPGSGEESIGVCPPPMARATSVLSETAGNTAGVLP